LRDPPRPVTFERILEFNSFGNVITRVTPTGHGIKFLSSSVKIVGELILVELALEGLSGGIKAG